MPKNNGRFIIDDTPKELFEKIVENAEKQVANIKEEVASRTKILDKRNDFFEGAHQKWTNVVGLGNKQQMGHILVAINYIYKFCQKIHHSLTNNAPRVEAKPKDAANPIETARAQSVEDAIDEVLKKNHFFDVIYPRLTINQIRDGDFAFNCKVMRDEKGEQRIEITPCENLRKLFVGWDDAAGTSFSSIAYIDMVNTAAILRDYGYEADAFSGSFTEGNLQDKGSHLRDQFGIFSESSSSSQSENLVPSGQTKLPMAEVIDWWGYALIGGKVKVVNIVWINRDVVQFVATDYKKIPWFIGHSLIVAGKPWSKGFIDDLIDPQIELNDRTGEEGDLVRVGAHIKFVAINMPDFDANSIKPGSGQVIFIEGENADFKPLTTNITNFPSESYINRMLDHLFTLGIPKIALAAGTAPYTGRVGAIQYQPFADLVEAFRNQWEIVFRDLIDMIQDYFVDYFPETHSFLAESIMDGATNTTMDGDLIKRDFDFDWDNVLPLSRSDKVVDASTMRDRGAISLDTFLHESGFKNPQEEIKKLIAESKNPDMQTLKQQFAQFSPGVVSAELEARKKGMELEEANAATQGTIDQASQKGTPPSNPPILTTEQNSGRRQVLTGKGSPAGQTSQNGNLRTVTQNQAAQNGV